MRKFFQEFLDFFKKGDLILLALCLLTTAFGCVEIASATAWMGATRYVVIQLVASGMGVALYAMISSVDLDFILEHRVLFLLFNTFLLFLLIPFGVVHGGNRSWLDFPFLPIEIQPAEICKITYIIIMTSVMASHQNRISGARSIFHMLFHTGALVGLNMIISGDAGVSLIFVFIFIGMTFAGGVHWGWFAGGTAGLAVGIPLIWNYVMDEYQRKRFQVLWDPSLDPLAINERYHTNQALLSLTAGGLSGQGLFNGTRTQVHALNAQHTDYIFSAIGEEMGFLGCLTVIVLEFAIIARVIYVGIRTPDFSRRLVCIGAASALIFQVIINVGMCLGITPVIGLTLPFVSYGGSSILSLYAMLGLVSGAYARPTPGKQGLYVHPPR